VDGGVDGEWMGSGWGGREEVCEMVMMKKRERGVLWGGVERKVVKTLRGQVDMLKRNSY
jgi:hypothetical protein